MLLANRVHIFVNLVSLSLVARGLPCLSRLLDVRLIELHIEVVSRVIKWFVIHGHRRLDREAWSDRVVWFLCFFLGT